MEVISLEVARVCEAAILPTYATEGSACFDFYACTDALLKQNRTVKVPTGLSFNVPRGYFLDVRPRSGLASESIILVNSPGTIDSDYRGEVFILLRSLDRDWRVYKGNRIAQGRLVKLVSEELVCVAGPLPATGRGEGGFGSTGR